MRFFLFILLIFFISSCKKKVENYDPVFIGYWIGCPGCCTEIEIDEESHGSYGTFGFSEECSYDSKGIARANKRKLSIGVFDFKILEYPTAIDTGFFFHERGHVKSYWRMKLKKPWTLAGNEVMLYKIAE